MTALDNYYREEWLLNYGVPGTFFSRSEGRFVKLPDNIKLVRGAAS